MCVWRVAEGNASGRWYSVRKAGRDGSTEVSSSWRWEEIVRRKLEGIRVLVLHSLQIKTSYCQVCRAVKDHSYGDDLKFHSGKITKKNACFS